MTTIYKLGEEVMKLYGQKMVGSKITRQESILAVSQAINKTVRDLIWKNKREEDNLTVPYVCLREYRLSITKDEQRNKWYATLPVRTLESIAYNMGIYQVAPADNIDETMIPTTVGFNSMLRGMDAYQLEGRLSYAPERDRIYIQGAEFEDDFELFVRVIPDATSLESDEEAPVPSDMELDVIQTALQLLGASIMSVPRDTQTDGI